MSEYSAELTEVLLTAEAAEPHIAIAEDRTVHVPDELQCIAVQFDHNIETVTFDCPRYWDEHDFSTMHIFVNYRCADGNEASCPCGTPTIDPEDESIIHFDWVLSRNVTCAAGTISFVVCAKRADGDGVPENQWHSRLNQEMKILEGLECPTEEIVSKNPDVIEYILSRLDASPSGGTSGGADKYVVSARKEFVRMPNMGSMVYKIVLEMSDGETVEVELPEFPNSALKPEDYIILSDEDPTADTDAYTAQMLVNTKTANLWVCTQGNTPEMNVSPKKWLNIAGGSGETSDDPTKLWGAPLELTEDEKTQARENIGAIDIDDIVLRGTTDPTRTTEGKVNQIYVNTSTGGVWVCTLSSSFGNTWRKVAELNGALDLGKIVILGDTDPTETTVGAEKQLYVNTSTGKTWVCTEVISGWLNNNTYTWLPVAGDTPEKGGGMSAAAADLLITILRNGAYTTDQNDNIEALAVALNGGVIEPDEPDEPDEPTADTSAILGVAILGNMELN